MDGDGQYLEFPQQTIPNFGTNESNMFLILVDAD